MPKSANNLPYFKNRGKTEEKIIADFLLRKVRPVIRKKNSQHFLVQSVPFLTLNFIKKTAKNYPYFLYFDIRLFYPSINLRILLKNLPANTGCSSRQFLKYLKNEIPEFLSKSPYGKGLPIGSSLSYALAGIFLLELDLELKNPFLRQTDDYLIFCKNKKEPEIILKKIILPKLKELDLEINERKLKSGKFHQDKINFIGFNFFAGHFTIKEEKIEEFKKRIIKLTYLTKIRPEKTIIKSINNQVLGFGHYYKFAECKKVFEKLDAFIRMRLRRYLNRNKDSKNRQGNLLLTNEILTNLGLKSLLDIKIKYTSKKKHIFQKTRKKKRAIGGQTGKYRGVSLEEKSHRYEQKLILGQLKELTDLVKKLEKKIAKIEGELVKK